MTHSDDNGLVLPPKLAPVQVVIIPIYRSDEQFDLICSKVNPIIDKLKSKNISVLFDKRDTHKPGFKFNEHEIKGVPIRIAVGPKDLENSTLEIFRRDEMKKETIRFDEVFEKIDFLLEDIQINLFSKAKTFTENNVRVVNDYDEFKDYFKRKRWVYFSSLGWNNRNRRKNKKRN